MGSIIVRTKIGAPEVPSYATPNGIARPPSVWRVLIMETWSYILGSDDRLTTCPSKTSHISRREAGSLRPGIGLLCHKNYYVTADNVLRIKTSSK